MSDPAPTFTADTLEKRSLGEHIAAHLQELLLDGRLKPGDTLPSQRELAQQYGTSVAAVREAISILSASGVLDARPGRGTVILPVTQQAPSINLWLGAVHDETEAHAFLDTRQALEHYTIARAARHATPEQHADLLEHLHRMRDAQGEPEAFIQADLALHMAIAQAAGNPVVLRLLRAIHMPLANLLRAISTDLMLAGRFPALYTTHEQIIHGIIRRDPHAATQAFDHMLDQTTEGGTLERALGHPERPEPPSAPLPGRPALEPHPPHRPHGRHPDPRSRQRTRPRPRRADPHPPAPLPRQPRPATPRRQTGRMGRPERTTGKTVRVR
ncbi:FadR/GntR family transcriptional regulator [Deinococcus aquaticus]|uniref:FadR/GntR family transcriptional regulator n=1 Tax=Deinococcus aquaticus TaxID=328692 RepID=UPI0036097A52